jgi:hypothetical protein
VSFRVEISKGKKRAATLHELMGAAAQQFAKLSDARAILVGPSITRADGSTGMYVCFSHPTAVAHAAWAMLLPALPADFGDAKVRFVLDVARQEFLAALRRSFRKVTEFDSSVELADAAVARWPCARTLAFRGNPGDVFAGNVVPFLEH